MWSVFVDRDGNVWAATARGAACLTAGGEWRTYTAVNSGLTDDMVTDIAQDAGGNLWFTTANGVSRLQAKGNSGARPAAGRPTAGRARKRPPVTRGRGRRRLHIL